MSGSPLGAQELRVEDKSVANGDSAVHTKEAQLVAGRSRPAKQADAQAAMLNVQCRCAVASSQSQQLAIAEYYL